MNWITLRWWHAAKCPPHHFIFIKITFQLCVSLCPDDLNSERPMALSSHLMCTMWHLFPFLLSKLSTTVICMARVYENHYSRVPRVCQCETRNVSTIAWFSGLL